MRMCLVIRGLSLSASNLVPRRIMTGRMKPVCYRYVGPSTEGDKYACSINVSVWYVHFYSIWYLDYANSTPIRSFQARTYLRKQSQLWEWSCFILKCFYNAT